jgi:UPF0716 protein FxsA
MPYLFILFILMPIIEIAVLIQVGQSIGVLLTIGIVILTAILGTSMLRSQGLATLEKARSRMNSGEMPAQQMLEGLLLVIGGVLLLTPGFVTDAFGFLCLIPPTREYLAKQLASRSIGQMGIFVSGSGASNRGSSQAGGQPNANGTGADPRRSTGKRSEGDVIEGDYREVD